MLDAPHIMSGHTSDTIELLSSPTHIQRDRKRGKKRDGGLGYQSEGGTTALDSLKVATSSEELTGSLPYLSDQGLPSERARIAASNRYRELQRSDREEESLDEERTPLLVAQITKESPIDGSGGAAVARYEHVRSDPNTYETVSLASDLRTVSGGLYSVRKERERLKREKRYKIGRFLRMTILTLVLVVSVILFAVNKEPETSLQIVTIRSETTSNTMSSMLTYDHTQSWDHVVLSVSGPFEDESFTNVSWQDCGQFLFFCTEQDNQTTTSQCQEIDTSRSCQSVRIEMDGTNSTAPPSFPLSNVITRELPCNKVNFTVEFRSSEDVSFQVSVRGELISNGKQVLAATGILVGVYFLIIFDLVHRTLAAFIGATATIATLSMLGKRPTLETVVEWIDLDTICLLFGMMTLVAIFSQTGFFDYAAVKAYKVSRGRIGPLITILCLLSAVVSAFLDNVTTILLLTPVSIRLCQVLNVNPLPVLIAEVVFSNIGGTATAVGDPPNVIIVSNDLIKSKGIDFTEFTLHLSLGIILCMVVAYAVLGCIYRTYVRLPNKDPPHIAEMKREIAIWERTAAQMPVISLEETAVRDALRTKANEVRDQLRREVVLSVQSAQDLWQKNLAQLERQYHISNPTLLVKSASVLLVVILLFFLADIIPSIDLQLGWIAIFGAVILLVLSDTQDLDLVLHKIEWSTLLFFAGLFVLMEGLQELGLIQYIGDIMVDLITMVPSNNQMLVALVLVVWVSALASSFIDNIPFTTATIPVIVELAESPDLCLSLRPLVWALAFGACLGGNGTLIGASANVVCAGIAEQNGYKISFLKYFIIGFPMMLATTFTAMIYLLICHVAFDWNIDSCPS